MPVDSKQTADDLIMQLLISLKALTDQPYEGLMGGSNAALRNAPTTLGGQGYHAGWKWPGGKEPDQIPMSSEMTLLDLLRKAGLRSGPFGLGGT